MAEPLIPVRIFAVRTPVGMFLQQTGMGRPRLAWDLPGAGMWVSADAELATSVAEWCRIREPDAYVTELTPIQ